MFRARGTKQRKAARRGFRSNSPTKRTCGAKKNKGRETCKETAEWEKNSGADEVFAAFTLTGEERATAVWMEQGRNILNGGETTQSAKEEANKMKGESFGFNFIGKKGRKGKEFTLRAVNSYKGKWDAQTMHLPPIDMSVPDDQKNRAMRTQINQQVERLDCKGFKAFEERKWKQWIEEQRGARQAWVTVIDNEDPGPCDKRIFSIFFAKHDEDCKWNGNGEMMLNPITTDKRGGDLNWEITKRTNGETEAQGCECRIDFGTMAGLETEMLMNQGKV